MPIAAVLLAVSVGSLPLDAGEPTASRPGGEYTVAIYYWPNFHQDAYHQSKKGQGWTEWEIVRNAKPKFEGHDQPKMPLWGYRDESDPKEMARSIDAMADAGIGAIIFDWYRYDDDIQGGVMIEKALRQGFLQAPNRNRVKFALMWANHTYIDCHPFAPGVWFNNAPVWRKGEVGRAAFERHTQDAIQSYFKQPNYWKIDGCPYFSIYEFDKLVQGLGGLAATRTALDDFRRRVKATGFPDLHLNIVDQASLENALKQLKGQPFPGDPARKVETVADLLAALKVDSSTMYTWVHHLWPMLVQQAGKPEAKPMSETGTAFGFADDAGAKPSGGPRQPKTATSSGVELVKNGGFEDGLAGWGKQQRIDLEVVPGGGAGNAVKATRREGRYSSPIQNLRDALLKSGPGYYELSVAAKAVSQPDKMFGVVRIEDDAGPRWILTPEAEVTAAAFKTLWVRSGVRWSGTLKSAEIYFSSQGNADAVLDNFRFVKLPESVLAKATPVERAAAAGIIAADYGEYGRQAMQVLDQRPAAVGVTYFPHVSMGWDGSPRNYSMGIVLNNTPEKWGDFLRQTKEWLDRHPESKGIVTLNSWNEWVEGSYIEPDQRFGTKYLDAVRDLFGRK
jgi:hypothetical protein